MNRRARIHTLTHADTQQGDFTSHICVLIILAAHEILRQPRFLQPQYFFLCGTKAYAVFSLSYRCTANNGRVSTKRPTFAADRLLWHPQPYLVSTQLLRCVTVTTATVAFERMLPSRFSDRLRSVNLGSTKSCNRKCSGDRPASWPMETSVKGLECNLHHSLQSVAEFKNFWSLPPLLHTFYRRGVNHRDSSTIYT